VNRLTRLGWAFGGTDEKSLIEDEPTLLFLKLSASSWF
jgi:hypothetical protein